MDKGKCRSATSLPVMLVIVNQPTRKTKVKTMKTITIKAGNGPEQDKVLLNVGSVRRGEENEVVPQDSLIACSAFRNKTIDIHGLSWDFPPRTNPLVSGTLFRRTVAHVVQGFLGSHY